MTTAKPPASLTHGVATVKLVKEAPEFASASLADALEESGAPGGQQALLSALRRVAEAQGMAAVAQRAGVPHESLCRALSANSNPTIKTLLACNWP
jgi:probable addiction module antidote protein